MSPYPKPTALLLLLVYIVGAQCGTVETNPVNQTKHDPEENLNKIEVIAEPSQTSMGALGQGFALSKIDLLTKQFKSTGAKIFEDLPMDECTETGKLGTISKDDSFYSSTKSLYQLVKTNTGVGGSLEGPYTLGASVSAVTNNMASDETQIQGVSLDLQAFSMSTELRTDCINKKPLAKELIEYFEALPKKIYDPSKLESWSEYSVLLDTYGSHFVRESISGSSIHQYVFAKSDQKFSERDFTVNACLSLAGPKEAGKVGVSACSGVSKKDIRKSRSQPMVKKLVIRGGSAATRAELTGQLSPEQINKFLNEAQTDPSPIQYRFYPIWRVLKSRYAGTEHFAKALNLEQFYKGFLHFGCSPEKTENGQEMQKFDLTDGNNPDLPTYECKLGPQGCHDDDDCHATWTLGCSCYGESCLRYEDKVLSSGSTKRVAYVFTESGWKGKGCERGWTSCSCESPRKIWQASWSGEDVDSALRDVHSILWSQRRRDHGKRHHLHC